MSVRAANPFGKEFHRAFNDYIVRFDQPTEQYLASVLHLSEAAGVTHEQPGWSATHYFVVAPHKGVLSSKDPNFEKDEK